MTIARAKSAGVLRVRTSDGKYIEFPFTSGQSLEGTDPVVAEAIKAQIDAGSLDAVVVRPAKIDHTVDTKPRLDPKAEHVKTGRV